MSKSIRCPFCHWNRIEDTSKGAPPFDRERAVKQLASHLLDNHIQSWEALNNTVNFEWAARDPG